MVEQGWYLAMLVLALFAWIDWRRAILLAVVADALRDPVRKLIETEPVGVTVSVAGLWLVLTAIAVVKSQTEFTLLFRRYPKIRTMLTCIVIALIPAALMSCVLYAGGYKLAIVGVVSYVAPVFGIGVGYLFARSEREIYRLFAVYVAVNSLLLVGTPLEFLGYDLPGLGGLKDFEWIRYRRGYTVDLISGFYRSPDIMGLHAAHVVMFATTLSVRSNSASRAGWGVLVLWAALSLMLCGRRKMIAIPLVFIAAFVLIGAARGIRQLNALIGLTIAILFGGLAVTLSLLDETDAGEYAEYAASTFVEGADRFEATVVNSSIGTLRQVGVLGAGVGTATQGRYYVNVSTSREARGWQEDGVSRVFVEFGIPGAILLAAAALSFVLALRNAIRVVPPDSPVQLLQITTLSVLVANAASFVISHQQFSGDPVSALWATMMAGMCLGAPRIFAMRARAMASRGATVRPPQPAAAGRTR